MKTVKEESESIKNTFVLIDNVTFNTVAKDNHFKLDFFSGY